MGNGPEYTKVENLLSQVLPDYHEHKEWLRVRGALLDAWGGL